jgi:hypothetical protein
VSVVVDANTIVALVIADERQPAVQAHLDDWVEAGEAGHFSDSAGQQPQPGAAEHGFVVEGDEQQVVR